MKLPYDDGHQRRRIYLVRHGHALGSSVNSARYTPDIALTADGIRQAQITRDFLRDVAFDEAWSSDITRAQQTAQIILEPHSLGASSSPAFREFHVDLMDALRQGGTDMNARLRSFAYDTWNAGVPDAKAFGVGEAYRGYADRAFEAIDRLVLDARGTTMLLVAHGGFNRAMLCWATGSQDLAAFGTFEQGYCSVNVIDVDVDVAARRIVRRHVRMTNYTAWDPSKRTQRMIDTEVLAGSVSSLISKLEAS